ncbi:MAG: DUF368 domain-containing protein [Actinomycetota bacterium]
MLPRIAAQLVRGFLMGSADVVPGVSGGTIALVLGIYERLVGNVHQGAKALGRLVRGDVRGFVVEFRRIEWWWIASLGAGIVLAVLVLASILDQLLEDHPEVMSAIFAGLVVASIWVAWGNLRNRDTTRLAIIAGVGVVAAVVLGLRTDTNDDPAWWFLIIAGAIAICAGILPGISGSFTLLMLGLYDHVIDAIDERDLATIALVGIGAVVGLALFSSALDWLLNHHHDTVVAALIGLMAGSLRILWPWPAAEEGGIDEVAIGAPESDTLVPALIGFVVAIVVVVGIASMVRQTTDRDAASVG